MKEITEYQILRVNGSRILVDLVQQAIKDGWQPFGPLVISSDGYMLREMVRYNYNPEEVRIVNQYSGMGLGAC